MNLFTFSIVLLLIVSLQQSEAPAPFFAVFVRLGYKLVKRTWYAKCNPRKYPFHMSCPSVVSGVGRTKKMAIDNAKAYADLTGDKGCGQ